MPNRRERDKGWWIGLDAWPPKPCFIATAAYGTDAAREIEILREFRDEILLRNSLGYRFVSFYYRTSPPLADFIAKHDVLRAIVREGLVHPVAGVLNVSRRFWT